MKYSLSTFSLPSNRGVTIFLRNKKSGLSKTLSFADTHPNFKLALTWLEKATATDLFERKRKVSQELFDEIIALQDIYGALKKWSKGDLVITRQQATYKGKPIDTSLEELLIKVFLSNPQAEDTFDAWTQYLELSTSEDVSFKVANRLFLFLRQNDLTITSSGKVLAWKVVRPDYKDKHSGTFDNSPGRFVSMPRSQVNDDDTKYCSNGLHICSWGYLRHFASTGDPVLQVEIDIRDIVSIPLDYNGEKVRVCKYKVLQDVGKWNVDVGADKLPKDAIKNSFATNVV